MVEPSSFRDPNGFVFWENDRVFRLITLKYKANYDHFINSGLYAKLVDENLIIPHEEIKDYNYKDKNQYKIIKPRKIDFISYPYEWCFDQLKDAALSTLAAQKIALDYGMILKDASAFNQQYDQGRFKLIDTLSFEVYEENKPWIAYKQFCQHFLAPLFLIATYNYNLHYMFYQLLDGIPLEVIDKLAPLRKLLRPGLFLHLKLHSKMQEKYKNKQNVKTENRLFNKKALFGLIISLEKAVNGLKLKKKKSFWSNYYEFDTIQKEYVEHKKNIIFNLIDIINPKTVLDVGSNTGFLSQIASHKQIFTLSIDFDHDCIEKAYLEGKQTQDKFILPLIVNICNPTPSLGWENLERKSFIERTRVDMVMALAVIHHLAISNNLPLERIADLFSRLSNQMIIEFVPKSDPQTQILLRNREDIFCDYTKDNFELIFSRYYRIEKIEKVNNSNRYIYLMYKN